jgi:FMN reductase
VTPHDATDRSGRAFLRQHSGMNETRRIVVLTAGTSAPSSSRRLGDRLASAAVAALAARGVAAAVEVVEVREVALDVATATLTRFPSPALARALAAVTDADGLVAVSPIFNASYSGLFKSFVDLLEPAALTARPVLVGATGGSERHSLALDHALKPLFSYLHALVLPTGVYAARADWTGSGGALTERIDRAGEELAAAVAATPARDRIEGSDFESDLEDLLRSID